MSERQRFTIAITMTIDADSEDQAFDYAYEAMCLAEGQGLMEHRSETVVAWHVIGLADDEPMFTSCGSCGELNIEIVDDSAPEFCDACG